MATKRFGYLDDFNLKSTNVGIGTSDPTTKLEVVGGTRSKDLKVIGIATLSSYGGFQNTKTSYGENIVIDSGESGTLSGEVVVGTGFTISVGTGATTGQGSIKSLKVSNTFTPPIGLTADRPTAPKPGSLFYNKDFRTIEYWDGNFWRLVDNIGGGGRAVWAGNQDPSGTYSHIQFTHFSTEGNTQYFGELTAATRSGGGTAGTTRGLVMGGGTPTVVNTIQYITVPAQGDAIDFGDLTAARAGGACVASSTRAIAVAGYESTPGLVYQNEIDYVEIMTKGNAADFGDTEIDAITSCVQSPTRGVFSQSNPSPSSNNTIAYITIASKGNATDFGLLSQGRAPKEGSASNSTRGIFGPDGTTMDYVTIATQGNAQAFTELTTSLAAGAACASQTRFLISGKEGPAAGKNIFMIQFATLGEVVAFGDLSMAGYNSQAMSNCHGGLGGF